MRIIAVNFDYTLSIGAKFTNVGTPNRDLFHYLINQQRQGNAIILWTCRTGKPLEDAIAFCKNYGLEFDYVNENHPNIINSFGNNPRKIFANLYIDNSSAGPFDFTFDEPITTARKPTIVRRG